MCILYVSYLDLSVNLGNPFISLTHKPIVNRLRSRFLNWKGFFRKYENYNLGFIVATKRGIRELEVKGPSVSRKMKLVDFSIFLPEKVEALNPNKAEDINSYLDLVFLGISMALAKYQISKVEIEKINEECKRELNGLNNK
ncbi:MAG TPA: hypothetical protein VF721_22185 [Pyrinomonadaceae bacterium]|jgi:hypothetical protein